MIYYSVGALIVGAVLFKLGSYTTIVSMLATGGKILITLLLFAGIVLLYLKIRGKTKPVKLPYLSNK